MPISNQPLDIKGFSGGLSDEGMSVTPQHYTRADNLLLTPQYDLRTRPGSVIFDAAFPQLPTGQQRINGLVNYDQDVSLLAFSGNKAYAYAGAGGWSELIGGAGDALHTGTTGASLSFSEWKKHIFVASSEQLTPVKVYKDNLGNYKIVTAGLPFMAKPTNYNINTATAGAITLANDIRSKLLTHLADTFMHKAADTVSQGILTSAAATNLATLIILVGQLQKAYQNHFNDYQGPNQYHTKEISTTYTTAGDQTLSTLVAPTEIEGAVSILNDLATRYNSHWGKVDIHRGVTSGGSNVTAAFVYGVNSGPSVDLDRNLFYTVANSVRAAISQHLNDFSTIGGQTTNAHKAIDSNDANDITLNSNASNDPYSLALLMSVVTGAYYNHETDAALATPAYHEHKEANSHQLSYFAPWSSSTQGAYVDLFKGCAAGNWTKTVTRLNELITQAFGHINEADQTNTLAHMAGTTYYQQSVNNTYLAKYTLGSLNNLALGTYTYAFTYAYTYTTTGGVQFEMEGPPLLVEALNVIKPEIEGLLISNIPPMANSASTNYDTANVKINIYRTTNGGQTLFYVDQISNGTTTYTDFTTDLALQTNRQIYTAGGVSDNEPAPRAKYVHITEDDFGYWGNVLDDDGTPRPNRIRQAIAGSPDACPGDYFVDLPYPVTGVSSVKGVRVAWTKKGTYRLEGTINERGQGSIAAVAISDSVGCLGGYGIVATDQGLVFPGSDGFYITNGYQVSKLSRDWRTTYLNLVRSDTTAQMIYGVLDKKKNRVWFSTSSTGAENDSCYILDLNLTLNENGPWTTASNRSYFAPSSIAVFNDQVVRGDSRGYVFKHVDTVTSDPKVDTTKAVSLWNITSIFPDYRSPDNDFGSVMMRKYVPKIVVKARNQGNMSLQINSINDGGKNIAALAPIRYRGGPTYGDPTLLSVGGGPTITGGGLPEYKRHFPAGSLRCSTKQVQFILAKVAITESDTLGLGTVDPAAKTLTVAGAALPDYVDHVVALVNDGYVREYTVLSNTATVLTLSDAGNNLPVAGSYKWVVRGYPKDEQWQLVNYLLYFNMFGTTQLFAADTTGENA